MEALNPNQWAVITSPRSLRQFYYQRHRSKCCRSNVAKAPMYYTSVHGVKLNYFRYCIGDSSGNMFSDQVMSCPRIMYGTVKNFQKTFTALCMHLCTGSQFCSITYKVPTSVNVGEQLGFSLACTEQQHTLTSNWSRPKKYLRYIFQNTRKMKEKIQDYEYNLVHREVMQRSSRLSSEQHHESLRSFLAADPKIHHQSEGDSQPPATTWYSCWRWRVFCCLT